MAATFRLFYFLKTPNDAQRIIALCRRNEAAVFQGLYRIARRRQGPDDFAVFEPTQQRIAALQIGLKLIAVLQVREQVLFGFVRPEGIAPAVCFFGIRAVRLFMLKSLYTFDPATPREFVS